MSHTERAREMLRSMAGRQTVRVGDFECVIDGRDGAFDLAPLAALLAREAALRDLVARSRYFVVTYATNNPKHDYLGVQQDPSGAHALAQEIEDALAAAPTEAPAPDTVPVPRVVAWSGGKAPYRFLRVILDDTPTEHEYVPRESGEAPAPAEAQTRGERMRDAGYTRRPTLREFPSEAAPAEAPAVPVAWMPEPKFRTHPGREGTMRCTCDSYPHAADCGTAFGPDQMRAARESGRREMREACVLAASIHSQYPIETEFDRGYDRARKDAAAAIRALP